jgi:putative redox protein
MAQVTVRLADGLQAIAQVRNHTWFADEPVEDGGTDTGPTPTEMFLGSLGACIAMTAKLYAQRKGWPLESIEVKLELERFKGTDYPGYTGDSPFVHEIREQVIPHGPLNETQKTRILEIAQRCPVRRVLTSPAFFTEFHIQSAKG